MTWGHSYFSHYRSYQRFDLCFSAVIRLLIVLRQPIALRLLTTFSRSDNPISAYTFRCLLWACQLDGACNAIWFFIYIIFTQPHWLPVYGNYTFLHSISLDPYIRKFVSPLGHSHHEYFIDPRPIDNTSHLWVAFGALLHYGCFQPSSPSFWHLEFPLYLPVGVSGQAFQGVPPSFHLSDYQFS